MVDKDAWYEAELHRIKGELLLRQAVPDAPQAEACFQQALAVARRQQARSWELRAAMSLSRLWQQQGKRAEARELLAPIYSWFTEGFDTPDLQEARVLLEELGGEEKRRGLLGTMSLPLWALAVLADILQSRLRRTNVGRCYHPF